MYIDSQADALLLLSLISGRNPELLIGQHVSVAPVIRRSGIEAISTGYILVDGGRPTSVSYISNTTPIPADKPDIVACTAMAGEMLGLSTIYLDAGSGALNPVSKKVISKVRKSIDVPLIVGGGTRNAHDAKDALDAGADLIVVGNILEQNNNALIDIAEVIHQAKSKMSSK